MNHTQPQSSSHANPPSFVREPSPNVADARADPRFATHLRPIFTEAIAEQQEKIRQAGLIEADRRDKAQKSKQRIAIYPWTTENTAPTIKLHQNFTWPYVTVDNSLLDAIGLLEASRRGDLRIYDDNDVFDWVAIDQGYVMEVREGQRLFLKDASLRMCPDFDRLFDARSQPPTHLYDHLATERTYVREAHKQWPPSSSPQPVCLLPPQPVSPSSPQPNSPSSPQPISPTGRATSYRLFREFFGEGPIPFTSQEKAPTASSSTMAQPSHIDVDALDDPSESEVEIVEKHWPNAYFTAEIAACLRECSSRTHRRSQAAATQHSVFNKHFPHIG